MYREEDSRREREGYRGMEGDGYRAGDSRRDREGYRGMDGDGYRAGDREREIVLDIERVR